jgi:hypothetical protein
MNGEGVHYVTDCQPVFLPCTLGRNIPFNTFVYKWIPGTLLPCQSETKLDSDTKHYRIQQARK